MANGGRIDFTVGFKTDKTGLNEIKKSLNEVKNLGINDLMKLNPGQTQTEARKLFGTLQSEIAKVDQAFDKAFDPTTGITNLTVLNTALKKMDINKLSTTFKQAGQVGENAFNQIAKQAMASTVQFKKAETVLDKMGRTLTNTIKWNISSSLVNRFTGSIQQAYGYIQHLDTSLNDIRIVTGKSADEMDRFAEKANKAAKSLGASTTAYTEAALIYYQQGLSDEESQARAETTLKAANVTGQTGREVSEQLTSVWNGYKVSAEETELYVDKLAAVAASTASDLEELSTGMSKVASAANNMGVDIDQLNAQLATIISVTRQAPETAGTALKTIYARMEDLKIDGSDEDGVKLGEVSSTLDEVGVHIMDTEGNMRDLGEVIEEVGNKWETWTDAQQAAIAQAIAGKRQYNNLLALFDGWDMYNSSLETSRNAMGTLQKQQDIYMESTAAHLQQLKTAWEGVYDSLLDPKDINGLIDGLTTVVKLFEHFIDSIGGGKGLLLNFGGVALTVLRNQLGASLGEVINNMRGAKKEAQELAAQSANIKLFGDIQGKSTVYVDALKTAQAELSNYYDVLTGDQIEAGTELALEAAKIADSAEQWKKATEAADTYLQKIAQLNGNKTAGKDATQINVGEYGVNNQTATRTSETKDAANKILDNTESKINSIIPGFEKIQELYRQLKEGHSSWEEAFTDSKFEKKFNEINKEAQKLYNLIEELQSVGLIDEKDAKLLKTGLEKFTKDAKTFQQDMKVGSNNTRQVGNEAKKATNELNKSKKAADDISEKMQNVNNTTRETVENAENLNNTFEKGAIIAQQKLSAALKDALVKNLAAGFTQAAGGLASFAGGLTSLKSGFEALSNTDLSWGERLLQFTSSLGMGLTTTLTGISNLRKGLSSLTDVTKLFTAEQQVELINSTSMAGVLDAEALVRDKLTVTKLKEKLVSDALSVTEKIELAKKYGLISASEIEAIATGEVTEAEVLENIIKKLKNKEITKEILLKGLLIIKDKALAAAKMLLNKWTLILTAAIIAATAAYTAWRHHIENTTASIDAQAKSAQEQAKATKEQNEKIKELVKSYQELKEEYGEDDIDILRDRVYKLCVQYGLEQEAIQALTANYQELDDMMKKVQQDSAKEVEISADRAVDLTQSSIARHLGQDNKIGFWSSIGQYLGASLTDPVFGSDSYIATRLQPGKYTQIKGLNGISGFWNKDLRDTLESFGVEITKTGAATSESLSKAFIYHGKELQEALSTMNSAGAMQILQMMEDQSESIQEAQTQIEERSKAHAETIIDTDLIKTADDYRKALDQLVNDSTILAEFDGDKEKAEEWAKAWLNAIDSVTEAGEKANLSDKIANALGLSTEQTDKYSRAQLTFIDENANIARTFDNIDDFLNKYNDFIEAKDEKEVLIKLGVVLESSDGEKFDEETINSLFEIIGDRFSMSQSEFLALDFSEQKQVLQDYIDYNLKLYREDANNAIATYDNLYKNLEDKQKRFEEIGKEHFANVDMSQSGLGSLQNLISLYTDSDFTLYDEAQKRLTLTKENIADLNAAIEEAKKQNNQKDINRLEAYKQALVELGDDADSVIGGLEELAGLNDEIEDSAWLDTLSAQLAPTIDSIKQLEEAYKNGSVNASDYTKRYQELDYEQDMEDIDEEELADYSKYLQDIADSSDELSDELTDNADAADIVSKSVIKMNKGVEELSSGFENWSDVLKNSSKMSKEYMDALSGMRKAIAKLLDISEDYVSEDFLQNNMEQIGKAAEGDAEAIDELRKALSEDVVMNLELDDESIRDDLLSSVQSWQEQLDNMNLEVGTEVDNASFINSINQMIETAGLGVDQVNALLDSMGYEANFATEQQRTETIVPITTVHHTRKYLGKPDKYGNYEEWEDTEEIVDVEQKTIEGYYPAFALTTDGSTPKINSITKKATGSFNNGSTTNKGGNSSSSSNSSNSSSSSSNKPDKEEYIEHEIDLYRAINEELDDIESTLGRIQKFDDHSWGLTAKKALEQENKLLKQQLDMLEKKKDTYERDLGARRGALESQGINFSEDGSVMTNAEDKINQLYGEYNAMVDKYNAMSADDQESFKETLEAKKDSIDKIEDAIDKYEDGYNDYNSVLDELLDTHYELIENEVNHFNADIDVHLELDEAEQEWNDFWYEVVKDIEDEDFAGKIAQSVGKLNTLIGTVGKTRDSQVAELTNHLNEVTAEVRAQIAAAARGGEGSLFQDDSALSKENLENYRDKLMDAVRTAKEEIDEMSDTYLEALDHAQDLIDDQVEGWEAIGDHIEHDLELIQMVSGDKAFDALNKQFEQQYKNNLQLIQTQRMSTEYWQERMKYYEQMMATEQEGSEMYKMYSDALETASENYRKAVSDLDKTVEDALKKLEEWRKNQVAEITDSLDKALSKNMGLEDLKQQWDLVVEEQDYYLDNVERAIEMEGLQNEFDDVLNAMDERGAKQQEFLKWQDEELRKLNEKNKLTQYDIDEVKARLELKRQELALEEAQQNKSNLRLRRDSQGNYTYQYVADEGNVEDAEDKMLTAKREWYELVKKRNEETTNEVIDIRKRLLEAENEMAEALAAHNDEAYENAKARYEFLIEYEKELMEEGEKAKRDFYSGTAEFFADVNDNQILPMWDTTIQQMIDKWDNGGKNSFIGATISAIGDLEEVQRQFGNHTEEILYTAGVNYQDLVERGIDPTTEALEDMQDSNEVLNVSLEETNDLMNQLADELSVAIDAYNSLKDAAVNAIREANDALETLARTAIETSQQVQSAIAAANSAASAITNMKAAAYSRANSDNGPGGSVTGPTKQTKNQRRKRYTITKVGQEGYGVWHVVIYDAERGYTIFPSGARLSGASGTNYSTIMTDDDIRLWEMETYKSGGYTGNWRGGVGSDNGRLAVLHQKELVLNESDTTNILNAVKAVRDIVSAQASPNFSGVADSIANMAAMQASAFAQIGSSMLSAIASSVNNNNSDVSNYRNMTVNADFSGVRSADAIYQALRELENYGAQQAYSSAPHANSSY